MVDAVEPVEVAVDSGAARGAEPAGAGSGGAEPSGAEPGVAESRGAESAGAGSGGAEPRGAEPGGADPGGTERGMRSVGVLGLLVWPLAVLRPVGSYPLRRSCASGLPGAGAVLLELEVLLLLLVLEVLVLAVLELLGRGLLLGLLELVLLEVLLKLLAVLELTVLLEPLELEQLGVLALEVLLALVLLRVLELALLELGVLLALVLPLGVLSRSQLQPASPLPAPSPYTGPTGGLAERREPASRPASPVRAARTSSHAPRQRPPAIPGAHEMALRPSTAPLRVPLPSPPESSLPVLADPEYASLRVASPTLTRLLATVVTDPSFESTFASALVAELVDFASRCRLDYATSLVALSEAAIEGPYSSQWQSAMDAEMASWKSTGTYVDEVPPPGANIVSGMWIFRVKRPPGSPPVFKARYMARGFSQQQGVDYFQTFSPTPWMTTLRVLLHIAAQRDYELHSLDFCTAFLQDSLHEEIWLRCPPGSTGSFPPGTQWSLRRSFYGLRQAPREWHDTLRTTLAALGFAPSTADTSLLLRSNTSLPPFYILVYVEDLVIPIADTAGLAHVKFELQKRHTCTDLGEVRSYLGLRITRDRAQRTITLTQSHMVQQVLQRFDFTYSSPQATLSTRHSLSAQPSDESVQPKHMAAAKRVLRYLCSTSGMGLVLGGRRPVVLTGHADASWADDQATQRSSQGYTFSLGSGSVSWRSTRSSSVLGSSCEAEIYAGAMAAQELR
ncbi:unnamed protein product [Closterium sp. NIES-65]|nr:unnamed protein product [Closterium sp. NIES-65]